MCSLENTWRRKKVIISFVCTEYYDFAEIIAQRVCQLMTVWPLTSAPWPLPSDHVRPDDAVSGDRTSSLTHSSPPPVWPQQVSYKPSPHWPGPGHGLELSYYLAEIKIWANINDTRRSIHSASPPHTGLSCRGFSGRTRALNCWKQGCHSGPLIGQDRR